MWYYVGFVFPGSAEADSGCSRKLDSHLIASCVVNINAKIIKIGLSFFKLQSKMSGMFFPDTVYASVWLFVHLFADVGVWFFSVKSLVPQ